MMYQERAIALGLSEDDIYFALDGKRIDSDFDYDITWFNDDKRILYGRPLETDGRIPKPEHLHKWINGVASDSFVGKEWREEIRLPGFIKHLKVDSFRDCKCYKRLVIPTHLFPQLTGSGLEIMDGCKVFLDRTGNLGINDFIKKKGIDWITYENVLKKGEHIRVYSDKLTILSNEEKNEKKYVNNFYWKKFYNNSDELIYCMLLTYYKIIIVSDVTLALIDIYDEIDE